MIKSYNITLYNKTPHIVTDIRTYVFENKQTSLGNTETKQIKIGFLGGVHGNEPAGAYELQHLIDNGYFSHISKLHNMCIKVLPRANEFGLKNNTRYMNTNMFENGDLNRVFYTDDRYNEHSKIDNINIIKNFFNDCDIVIDFHEGWSWNLINSNSLGSSITPSHKELHPLCEKIVNNLNNNPDTNAEILLNNKKRFTILPAQPCEIQGTYSCHRATANKFHILIEITGQNDIQHINLRRRQVKNVVNTVINFYSLY